MTPRRSEASKKPGRSKSRGAALDDLAHGEQLLLALLAIPGPSLQEAAVLEFIRDRLVEAGAPASALRSDDTHRRSPFGGQAGNLVLRIPGTVVRPRRLLMAHVDTVPLCQGTRPVRRGEWIVPAQASTGLGADDRAGAAATLFAATEILRRGLPHPPLTFLWSVQEEIGLYGARHLRLGLLGRPRLAFNFDGGSAEKITIGATGGYRMTIHVDGIASHAGNAPEKGVSAVVIAGLAIAELHRQGWHGRIQTADGSGTSNIGVIQGGEATNVVTPQLTLRAEARSHDPTFRKKIVRTIIQAFRQAARSVRNSAGRAGRVRFDGHLDYESFRLPIDEPSVRAAEVAVREVGGQPRLAVSNGGLDANWMTARGIPTVSLGCGQVNPHTTAERLQLSEFHRACRVALRLATTVE
jgi:tripeptide aminopeptidase